MWTLRAGSQSDCARTFVELRLNRDDRWTLQPLQFLPFRSNLCWWVAAAVTLWASGPSDGKPGTIARPKEGHVGERNVERAPPTSGLSHEHSCKNKIKKDDTRIYIYIYVHLKKDLLNTLPTLTRCKTSHLGKLAAASAGSGTRPVELLGVDGG